jgi:serine/threonine protein kinase
VAIKVLSADFAVNKERVARFEQEAQAAGALNHPNILAIYDVNKQDHTLYVVSELLSGEELRDRLGLGQTERVESQHQSGAGTHRQSLSGKETGAPISINRRSELCVH